MPLTDTLVDMVIEQLFKQSPDHQHKIATRLAANVGYNLTPDEWMPGIKREPGDQFKDAWGQLCMVMLPQPTYMSDEPYQPGDRIRDAAGIEQVCVDDYSDALFGRGSDDDEDDDRDLPRSPLDELAALIGDAEPRGRLSGREIPERPFALNIADILKRPRDADTPRPPAKPTTVEEFIVRRSFPDPARLRERPRPTKPITIEDIANFKEAMASCQAFLDRCRAMVTK